MKLKFTRKTWYFLLLASAAASMLNGFAVLSGTSFGLIEQIAFAAAGIAALFLAAEKGSASWEKRNFTGVFVLLMVSYMVNGWAGYLCSALAWPLLLSTEYKRGMAVQRQLQLVGAAEALHLFFLLMAKYGGMAALGFWTNLLWVLLACARGWAALSLYKTPRPAGPVRAAGVPGRGRLCRSGRGSGAAGPGPDGLGVVGADDGRSRAKRRPAHG